jgi:hypothetical protein
MLDDRIEGAEIAELALERGRRDALQRASLD